MKIAVDLDGTLVEWGRIFGKTFTDYDPSRLGDPIPKMIDRVKVWLEQGHEVVIFTARMHPSHKEEVEIARQAINKWSLETFGKELEITCMKDRAMEQIWDDRAVSVERDTGRVLTEGIEKIDECSDAIGSFLGV